MQRVRGIIIKKGKILTIKRMKPEETYWVIPGGGVEDGETNETALIREMKEELGIDVIVGKLIFEMDSQKPETAEQREYFYLCSIEGGEVGTGHGPEFQKNTYYVGSHEPEWLEIRSLDKYDLKPDAIKSVICGYNEK